jgi:uroporphyrinogen-III synthase
VTFTATSSLTAFLALRTREGAPVPIPPHVVCIGPTTAAAARAAGLAGVHEAWGASTEGIMAELIGHFGPHEGTAS